MKKLTLILKMSMFAAVSISSFDGFAADTKSKYYSFNSKGELQRPLNYREWIFAGTATTPKSIYPDVLFPDSQNVYIDPQSYQEWKENGEFPDGTILVKEILNSGKTDSPVGKGFFQGEYRTLSASVKSKEMFPNTVGNWGYFGFVDKEEGKLTETAVELGTRCSGCHVANAPNKGVFYNYLAVLRDAKGVGNASPENSELREGLKK